jgi:hypothetical protein
MWLKPAHPIVRLALSPDGQRLGVVQSNHGLRVLNVIDGSEELHIRKDEALHHRSMGRHILHLYSAWNLQLARLAAGFPALDSQSRWSAGGAAGSPDGMVLAPIGSHPPDFLVGLTQPPTQPGRTPPLRLDYCSLSPDHRLAVGRFGYSGPVVLHDLTAEETLAVVADTNTSIGPFRATFTPAGDRIVLVTPESLRVFDLPATGESPPPARPPEQEPSPATERRSLIRRALDALFLERPEPFSLREMQWRPSPRMPLLKPVVAVPVSLPQPGFAGVPPFAVLACGTKMIVRGRRSRIELRDLETGAVQKVWKWGLPLVQAVAVAADGMTAAAGGTRGRLVVWDLE